jgi:RNA polymerase sigma-70 factor (ECF subfamily)
LKNERDIKILLHRISNNGDEIAFQELFELYVHGILRFSNSILRNKELSEEVVSDVFFNLWVHRAKLDKIENLKAYISPQ